MADALSLLGRIVRDCRRPRITDSVPVSPLKDFAKLSTEPAQASCGAARFEISEPLEGALLGVRDLSLVGPSKLLREFDGKYCGFRRLPEMDIPPFLCQLSKEHEVKTTVREWLSQNHPVGFVRGVLVGGDVGSIESTLTVAIEVQSIGPLFLDNLIKADQNDSSLNWDRTSSSGEEPAPTGVESDLEDSQRKHELMGRVYGNIYEARDSGLDSDTLNVREKIEAFIRECHPQQDSIRISYLGEWELPAHMKYQFEHMQSIFDVIALTGLAADAQATTVSEYVSQNWPQGGPLLLQLVDEILERNHSQRQLKPGYSRTDNHTAEVSQDDLSLRLVMSRHLIYFQNCGILGPFPEMKLEVTAPSELQVEVANTLCWLAATFRTWTTSTIETSRVKFERFQFSSPGNPLTHERADFQLRLEGLKPLGNSDMCWHPLFTQTAMAVQFPVPSKKDGIGLEIPLSLMASLAGIVMAVEFQDGLILKGLSTALIPIRECDGGAAIQWHLFHTESADGLLEIKDPETGETDIDFLKVKDLTTLSQKKAYLGWCKHASILLGTDKFDYTTVNWSGPAPEKSKITLSGFSLGLSSSGMGMFGPSATMNFVLAKNQRTRYMNIEQQLGDRLKLSIKKPALIYDTSTQRGWLVPVTCILLLMVHLRHRELGRSFPAIDSSHSDPAEEGGIQAYKVLSKLLHPSSEETWSDYLALFFTAMDMALKDVTDLKDKMPRNGDSDVYGFELLDIVRAESPFRFSQRKIQKQSGGWAPIAQDVGYALFCSGLGEVMVPGLSGNRLCERWAKAPIGHDYLGAYVPCILEILERQGRPLQSLRLHDHDYQCILYQDCNHKDGERCSLAKTYSSLVEWSPKDVALNSSSAATEEATEMVMDGAIIVGKNTTLTKKRLPVEVPVDCGP
ncbi:MAG: hypothetical protein LQ338_007307, partial [Usnochroma carphineum]